MVIYALVSIIGAMKMQAWWHFAVLQVSQILILSSVPIIHFGNPLTVILITSTFYIIKEKDVKEQVNTVPILSDWIMHSSTTRILK